MIAKKIFIFLLICTPICVLSQDIHFSQMNFSTLQVNPGLAGLRTDLQGTLLYKSQWRSVSAPYSTMLGAFDLRVKNKSSRDQYFGIGLNIFNDRAGEVKVNNTQANLNVSYHFHMDRHQSFGGGIYGGFGQKSLQAQTGQWSNQFNGYTYDASLSSGENFSSSQFTYMDFGAGLVYSYKKREKYMTINDQVETNIGAAVYHVNKPVYSFMGNNANRLPMRFSFFASGIIGKLGTKYSLLPAIYLNLQGKSTELLLGTYVKYRLNAFTSEDPETSVSAGIFYRYKDAAILNLLYEWNNYSFGVAYDLNVSSLADASKRRGGLELFLRFKGLSPWYKKNTFDDIN